jgi:hypothetical protein
LKSYSNLATSPAKNIVKTDKIKRKESEFEESNVENRIRR